MKCRPIDLSVDSHYLRKIHVRCFFFYTAELGTTWTYDRVAEAKG